MFATRTLRAKGAPEQMPVRWIAACAAVVTLLGLLAWKQQRYALVSDCHRSGGWWDGFTSRCRNVPPIILERDLKRS